MSSAKTFHVVCHDCCTESLVESKHRARAFVDEHSTDSGHTVEFERVA
jgi:hypothetical protein